jgi:hypothetical protein
VDRHEVPIREPPDARAEEWLALLPTARTRTALPRRSYKELHAVHQPAAFTCLPAKTEHGPWTEPAAPEYSPQFAHLLPDSAFLACAASSTYCTATAAGSVGAISGASAASAFRVKSSASDTAAAESAVTRSSPRRVMSEVI